MIKLWLDVGASWSRLFLALLASYVFSWIIGIVAARSGTGEKVILPALDILQSVPILGFFPIVLVVFLSLFPIHEGVYLAVTFLIFTSMTWNITFAVYGAIREIPRDFSDLARLEKMTLLQRVFSIYIPVSWPKVAYNSMVSWSVALFYLVASEIFSLGNVQYQVLYGIGVDLANYGAAHLWDEYAASIAVLLAALVITYFFFLNELSAWAEKFKIGYDAPNRMRRSPIYKLYHLVRTSFSSRAPKVSILGAMGKISEVGGSHTNKKHVPATRLSFFGRKTYSRASPSRITQHHRSYDERLEIGMFAIIIGTALLVLFVVSLLSSSSSAPSPAKFFGGVQLLQSYSGVVIPAFLQSLGRIWLVYVVAAGVSIPSGIAIASNHRLYEYLIPVMQIAAAVPAPALLPAIVLVVAGLPNFGEVDAFLVILLGMIWYLIFNIIEGVRSIPREIWEVSDMLKLRGLDRWRRVIIPAILPSFITGSITAMGGGWNTLIIAEYFAVRLPSGSIVTLTQVSNGIGKLLDQAAQSANFFLLGFSIAVMITFIFAFNITVWRKSYRIATRHSLLEGTR